jgi:hypothetical protein
MARSRSATTIALLVTGLALAGLMLTACGDGGSPAATPTTAVASAFPSTDPPSSPPGSSACTLLADAIEDATLMQPGVADAIVAASLSGDPKVAAASGQLGAAYAAAVSSQGTDREPDAVAAVSAAGADMRAVCVEAGLATAG